MKTIKLLTIILCIFINNYVSASTADQISGSRKTFEFEVVEMDNYKIAVMKDIKFEGSAFMSKSAGSLSTDDICCWASQCLSIISVGRNLWMNGGHYVIPENRPLIWIIDGEIFVPGKGLLKPSNDIENSEKIITSIRENFEKEVLGVKYLIEDGFDCQGGEVKNAENYSLNFGDIFLNIVDGNLFFRGESYGRLRKGERVKISKSRKLSILRN